VLRGRLCRIQAFVVVFASACVGDDPSTTSAGGDGGTSAATAPNFASTPTISSLPTPTEGETLAATDLGSPKGSPPPAVLTQWQRCGAGGECIDIAGASNPTYVLTAADRDAAIRLRVTARSDAGEAVAYSLPTANVSSGYNRLVLGPYGTPLAYWTFNETSGTAFANRLPRGPSMNLVGAAKLGAAGADPPSAAVTLDGSGYLEVPGATAAGTDFTGQFAVEVWLKPSSLADAEIVAKHDASPRTGYVLEIKAGRFSATVHDGTTAFSVDGGTAEMKWAYVVLNDSGTNLSLWVNNVLKDSTGVTATAPGRSTAALRVGAESAIPNPSKRFAGTIDELATYGGNITAGTMTQHYDRLKSIVSP
jgi:hypothetical protein